MKKKIKINFKNPITLISILFLIYLLLGFILTPILLKNQIISFFDEEYSRKVEIESTSFNPLTFTAKIEKFNLFDENGSIFLSWNEFLVNLNIFSVINKVIDIEEIRLGNPNLNIVKISESEFNFSNYLTANQQDTVQNTETIAEEKWNVKIGKIELNQAGFKFEDQSLDTSAQFYYDQIQLIINNLSTIEKEKASFKIDLNNPKGGSSTAEGNFSITPLFAEMNINFDNFNFSQINPYINQFTYLKLEDGNLSSVSDLSILMDENSEIPDIKINGSFEVNNFRLYDLKENEKFFEFGRMHTTSISANTNPMQIIIGEISFNKLFTRIAIDEQQNINLQKIFKNFSPISDSTNIDSTLITNTENNNQEILENNITDSSQVRSANFNTDTTNFDFQFDIAKIKVINSEMYFSDFSLPLKFAAKIHDLSGDISGISKDNPLGAALDLKGIVDEYGLAIIKGNLNPTSPLDYSDIKINFNNIELTNLSPYSAKFMGYLIEQGKLTLDVEYLIKNGLLNSYSKIFLNKLNLGDEIESEEGVGFPVKLAVALLKDGDGNIDLDFEVEGDLNDPKTDTGKLVWWAVKRVLTSIVTAPFSFLGNLLGINGDEMEFIDFESGSSELLPNQIERINNISKAMNERPEIILEIFAAIDTVVDKNTIKEFKAKKVFTEKMTSAATDTIIDPLKVDVSISQKILENIYVESFGDSLLQLLKAEFTDSKNGNSNEESSVGKFDLTGYLSKLIKNIVSVQPVSMNELQQLANQRAEAIKNYLITKNQIPDERIIYKEIEIYNNADRNWVKCRMGIGTM